MKIEIIKGTDNNPVAEFFCSSPETDAFFLKRGAWSDEIVAFCRKLECERDEANSELNEKYIEYDQLFEEAEKIRIERDEAREALKKCREDSVYYAEHMRRCGYAEAYKESKENADRATRILEGAK